MNCPDCDSKTKVIESKGVNRRRQCLTCKTRFNTTETVNSDDGTIKIPRYLYDAIMDVTKSVKKNSIINNWLNGSKL